MIWYTIWMSLLCVMMSALVISAGGYLIRREAIRELTEEANDVADSVRYRDGRLFTDDLDWYDDGIFLQIFDQEGNLLFGRDNPDFPPPVFEIGRARPAGRWYVAEEDTGDGIVVRALMRRYDTGSYLLQIGVLLLLPLILALAALGGYFITQRSFRPVDKVIRTANEIAGSDDLSKRIGLKGREDEIHSMAEAFDRVLERLEASFEKERQFTSDASHELRTPLSVIKAECEYALSHSDDSGKMKEALIQIEKQEERMSRLVSELLSLARSDKGSLRVDISEFDLNELIEAVLSSMEERADKAKVSLSFGCSKGLMIEADSSMIARILINLVSNAIQYSREGGFVLVRAYKEKGSTVISVEDNGIGISAEDLPRIWDRFYQADSSRSSSSSGAGLGLPIVKALAKAHKGEVSAESKLGEGSIFTVRLPIG